MDRYQRRRQIGRAAGRDPGLQGTARLRCQRAFAAPDDQSVIKERFFLDKADPNTIYDEITVIDHGLTQPWTITKKASRKPNVRPNWHTENCAEENFLGQDRHRALLLERGRQSDARPRKIRPPPDLEIFQADPEVRIHSVGHPGLDPRVYSRRKKMDCRVIRACTPVFAG